MSSDDPLTCLSTFLDETLETDVPPVLLAVSGGCDSMVLLDSIARVREGEPSEVYVLHYDHRLNDHAARARELVTEAARERGFTPVEASARNPEAMRGTRRGLEGEARRWRYEFFQSVAEGLGVDHVLLGHHRLDQVETILLNLGRGAGPAGLTGMRRVSRRDGLIVCRPFLELAPEGLRRYAGENHLEYAEDPSNEDVRFARNRIRHRILPEWRKAQPDPDSAIVNHAARIRLENDFWEGYLEDRFREWVWSDEVQLDRERFRGSHPAAQLRYLHRLCTEVLSVGRGFDEGNYRDLRSLFEEGRSGARLSLPGKAHAVNEYGRGCVSTIPVDSWTPLRKVEPPVDRTIDRVGTLRLCGDRSALEGSGGPMLYADLRANFPEDLTIRSWSPGDRYEDEGKLRKLKSLFSERKVPYRARRLWPLVLGKDRVVAVPGLLDDARAGEESWRIGFGPDHPTFAPLLDDRKLPYLLEPGEHR